MAQAPDTPPSITVITPTDGAVFNQGTPVIASYTCADDSGIVASCTGSVPNGSAISTATLGDFQFKVDAIDGAGNGSTIVRHYSVVPVTGTPGGDTPATLNLALGAATPFAPFVPGIGKDYTTSLSATLTTSSGDATLTVADPSATATGRLVNGTFALTAPLQVSATSPHGAPSPEAPVGGSAAPTKLLTYDGPLGIEPATLNFKQTIGGSEALRTGGYSKTLTFTLSTTMP